MTFNSTIKQKIGECNQCGRTAPLTKGQCTYCYWGNIRMKSVAKQQEREVAKGEDLSTLINDLDLIYSRYIRLKASDLYGFCECVTCGKRDDYKNMQCGHFIPRQHLYTRFLEINTHVQCKGCNEYKRGNLGAYSKYLEKIRPGTVEALQEQSHIIYKYSREELKSMIADYTKKAAKLVLK